MRILAICLVKDEADVIEQSLSAACAWCDRLFVYDNGSTDGTWEAVVSLARRSDQIVPFKQDARPFSNGLRSEVFNAHRAPGDWWCILDADEFYFDDPRSFVLAADSGGHDSIWNSSYEYCFTDVDAARYREDPSLYGDDVPVEQKCRFYLNAWSEMRFFKDRPDLVWPERDGQPHPLRSPDPRRIRLRHFKYRSPRQIQRRLDSRIAVAANGINFQHERRQHWRNILREMHGAEYAARTSRDERQSWEERVVPASKLQFDAHDGNLIANEAALPRIRSDPTRFGALRGLVAKARVARARVH